MAFFSSLKQNIIAYRSSKVPDRIFEIYQLWQSGFSRVYSNCYCSCSIEAEIIKICQSSHKMYSNNIVNFQKSTTIWNACTKKSGNLLKEPRTSSLLFLSSPLAWRCPLLIFSVVCSFPFLQVFWCIPDWAVLFVPLFLFYYFFNIFTMAHFSIPNSIPIS